MLFFSRYGGEVKGKWLMGENGGGESRPLTNVMHHVTLCHKASEFRQQLRKMGMEQNRKYVMRSTCPNHLVKYVWKLEVVNEMNNELHLL